MKQFDNLWPQPKEIRFDGVEFKTPHSVYIDGEAGLASFIDDLKSMGISISGNSDGYRLTFSIDPNVGSPEGYKLTISENGSQIVGHDGAGLLYGIQTFLQVLAIYKGKKIWPAVEIADAPTYKKRCFMVDLGRSAFTMPMLRRIVRVLARLKINQLHVHLYDDELCGIRFEGLPFGWDNPHSISVAELGELVSYSAAYNVEIVPELEGWGHANSITHHRPDLRGGDGVYNGSSFLICDEMFDLISELTKQVVAVMPDKATIHYGLDEARWYPSSKMPKDFSPEGLVRRHYENLQKIAEESNKELTMRIWADHGGRPVPEEIQKNVIIEPWQYWNANINLIEKQIENYSGEEKMRFMMGAGQSMAQHRGAFHATRYWCKHAQNSPNVDGVNITFWGRNDVAELLITLFAGAYFAWNPESTVEWTHTEDYEEFDRYVYPVMHWWQTNFRDAFPDAVRKDSAPLIFNGFYLWGDNHGKPVAATAVEANTLGEHDFLQEGEG